MKHIPSLNRFTAFFIVPLVFLFACSVPEAGDRSSAPDSQSADSQETDDSNDSSEEESSEDESSSDAEESELERPVYDGTWTFTYRPPADAGSIDSVTVPGSFNNWDTEADAMEQQMDGTWEITLELEPGRQEYKFFINGEWPEDMEEDRQWGREGHDYQIDPLADDYSGDGHGGQNAVLNLDPDEAQPEGVGFRHDPERAEFVSRASGEVSVRFRASSGSVENAVLIEGNGTEHEMNRQLSYPGRDVWRTALEDTPEEYRIVVEHEDGSDEHGPYSLGDELFESVDWVGDSVGYQIFPERFANSNPDADFDERAQAALDTDSYNFKDSEHWTWDGEPFFEEGWEGPITDRHCCHQYFGGDLDGIRDRLDYLEDLGVSLLYMTPIFESGSVHGYDAHDYLNVAPNFGDEETLEALLEEAEARDMRVMWDFVPNHVGTGHWAFQEALEDGEDSEYWDWFFFHTDAESVEVGMPENEHYDSWWGLGNLPELHTAHPPVLEHLLEVTEYWSEFGFDGIRVDVPGDIRNRDEFFPAFRETAKDVSEDIYLVGEVWQRDPGWLGGDEFDSLMNYAIGQDVIEQFVSGDRDAASAATEMARLYGQYPEASVAMQFNIISSHDTARLLTLISGENIDGSADDADLERVRMAATMLYSLPGMPVTYQGDELGFLGDGEGPHERNRYPVQWDEGNYELADFYSSLAEVKTGTGALSSPVIAAIESEGEVLGFRRGEAGPGAVHVLANPSDQAVEVELPAGSFEPVLDDETGGDTIQSESDGAAVTVEVPARTTMLFEQVE